MSPEELDEATVKEARRRWLSTPALRIHGTLGEDAPFIAARLAREGWTPPEPVDPDLVAYREWASKKWGGGAFAHDGEAECYLAGARMARKQEQERSKTLEDNLALLSEKVAFLQAAYRGEA